MSDVSPTESRGSAEHHFSPGGRNERSSASPGSRANRRGSDGEEVPRRTATGRASKACDACRRRKIRCDQSKPRCNNCVSSDLECLFQRARLPRGRASKIIPELREQQLRQKLKLEAAAGPSSTLPSIPPISEIRAMPQDLGLLAPRPVIRTIINLYFEHVFPSLPIVHEAVFRNDFDNGRDTYDSRFYSLVLNLCAATAACLQGDEIPQQLRGYFSSWEDMGRTFNNALPPYRLTNMFREADTQRWVALCMLQNILLVATYERAMGSSIAFRLVGEATRFALSYGYHRDVDGVSLVDRQLRRAIFWVLFCWDKWSAINTGQPMSMRSDECDTALVLPVNDFSVATITNASESLHLVHFNHLCRLALSVEQVILQHRRAVVGRLEDVALRTAMHASVKDVLATPCGLNGSASLFNLISEPRLSAHPALQTSVISAFIFQKYMCLELYHRHLPLFSPQHTYAPLQSIQQLASHIVSSLSEIPVHLIDRTGPLAIDMLYECRKRLKEVVIKGNDPSGDPFVAQVAGNDLNRLDKIMRQVDRLRVLNQPARGTLGTRTPANRVTSEIGSRQPPAMEAGPSTLSAPPPRDMDLLRSPRTNAALSSLLNDLEPGPSVTNDVAVNVEWPFGDSRQNFAADGNGMGMDFTDMSSVRFFNSLPFDAPFLLDGGMGWEDLLQPPPTAGDTMNLAQ